MELDQALQALYNPNDQATRKQADEWLTKFQQTPPAWQASDALLSRPEAPGNWRFFAAQTMRAKVQFDFYELPADSYPALRDSLLGHIDRYRDGDPSSVPIHKMLAIALADLIIQMDSAWPNPVPELFNRFGQNAESYQTLLEVLRMLPEECVNYKLMTDSSKRQNARERFQRDAPQVIHFLLTLQCPNAQAKGKVLQCFLSWIKFADLQAINLSSNGLIPECMQFIVQGSELSETATDIFVEILRMGSQNLAAFQPIIQTVVGLLPPLRSKFESLLAGGAQAALGAHEEAVLQICRIYVELGECLVPVIMEQIGNEEVQSVLKVILQCTDLPSSELSCIPFDFWGRLAEEIEKFHHRHPEHEGRLDQFQGIYASLLSVALRRCAMSPSEDPFLADDDVLDYRSKLLTLARDCQLLLTPNRALELVLKSLQEAQAQGVVVQEAHFYILGEVGYRAEVTNDSVLWALIQGLPPLIQKPADDSSAEGIILQFTKKTAIELLGSLARWLAMRPDFLRSALDMVATLLLQNAPQGCSEQVANRMKAVQASASEAFKNICKDGQAHLHDMVGNLTQLYQTTMALPIRVHLNIVDGIGVVVAQLHQDDMFRQGLESLVHPLVQGLHAQRENPQVLAEILDRLTTIIRQIQVLDGSAKAATVGSLISNGFWPCVRQTLEWHPHDTNVVEKSCRLLKHSMRCVPDLFKHLVTHVAETLIRAFQAQQHSSYLYSAEILANTYASDPEIVPVLTRLFHELSNTALHSLAGSRDRLESISELLEDFYGMFERYLRYAPMIVLEAPTLQPALQLLHDAIFVQQKDAVEATIAFAEATLSLVAEGNKTMGRVDDLRVRHGQLLRPQLLQVCPGLVLGIFKLVARVPTRYVQTQLPQLVDCLRLAFPQEFPMWLEAALQQLPPSAASPQEQLKLGQQLACGDLTMVEEAMADFCYRCEQVTLRARGNQTSGKR